VILSAAEDNNTRASFNRSTSFAFVSLAVSVTTPKCTRSLTARATDAIVFVAFLQNFVLGLGASRRDAPQRVGRRLHFSSELDRLSDERGS
jgi:hypothetical protein